MSFGADTWCTDSLRTGRLVTGTQLLAHALYRRMITPRGVLRGGAEESAYGVDVTGYVGAVGAATAIAALPNILRAELMKDDRVQNIVVRASLSADTGPTSTIIITIDVYPSDDTEAFSLTLAASEVETQLLGTGTP